MSSRINVFREAPRLNNFKFQDPCQSDQLTELKSRYMSLHHPEDAVSRWHYKIFTKQRFYSPWVGNSFHVDRPWLRCDAQLEHSAPAERFLPPSRNFMTTSPTGATSICHPLQWPVHLNCWQLYNEKKLFGYALYWDICNHR
jgi:hypothetical protein